MLRQGNDDGFSMAQGGMRVTEEISVAQVRVLYWTQLFWPYVGGVEVLASKFLPAMRERGYEFVVVTSHGSLDLPDEDNYNGISIYRFPFRTALTNGDVDKLVAARQRLAKLKRAYKPDLVHVHFTDPSVFFHWQTSYAHSTATLVAIRYALPDRPAGTDTLTGQTLRNADWITADSSAMLMDVHRLVPETIDRSSVIYSGLEMPELVPQPLPVERPRLLCLGRVVEDKGFDVALRAFQIIVKRFHEARLVIAGDGPARPSLERLSAELEIANEVEFAGWTPPEKVPELMNSATVVLMPSRCREAFGLVALEAAQMARPVVATRVGGLPEVVVDKETGLLVPKEDPLALAEGVVSLLKDPGWADKMGKRGRERAQSVFSWDRYVDSHDELYQQLVHTVESC